MKNNFIFTIAIFALTSCAIENKKTDVQVNEIPKTQEVTEGSNFLKIEGQGPNGDSVRFKDIKAKYILVEFWASWCPPCRQFNPGLVKLYQNFKPKGFEVLSISLDHDATKWRNAIAKDGMSWPYHISDLGGWDSHWAVKFGIESIPDNFLVDSTGKLVASRMNHDRLEATLIQLLK